MSEQFDSENLMYITKEYENNLRETARKIYANDEVKLTIENIDKQLNDILIEMNDKLNFISGKIHDPETGVDAYLEGVHTQIDNIEVDARDMIDDGVETTQSHPSVMSVKSDRNATKFNTYDFINKSIRLDANSPLLRFNSKNGLEDDDNVYTFRINHDKKEYIKIIEFSFTYKQYPSVMNKNEDVLEEEPTVTVTRVISGRFFIIWEDPFNEPGKFIIKAIVENADNTGNIIDKKVIDVKELSNLKEANYKNWKASNIPIFDCECIILVNNGRLVAGGYQNGIKYSDDNGITWIDTNITSGNYSCITLANDGRLVAGSGYNRGNSDGIKYSDDNGITWNDSNITSGTYTSITVANDGTLVAVGSESIGIKYSDNNGITWKNTNITSGDYACIIVAKDGRLVAGGSYYNGIKYSDDNGITWNDSNVTSNRYICITLVNNGRLIAGSGGDGGYQNGIKYSDDNGITWNDSNITSGNYACISVANDGRLVACGDGGIKYSDDNGKTWNDTNITIGYYYCITVANDDILLAGSNGYGIKYSDDNGKTWNDTNITDRHYKCITLANNGRLIAGGYSIKYLDTTKSEIEDLSVILDDGPQFDLYFTTEGNSIDISIGKVVPYRWLMRKNYITLDSNKPVDNISVAETLETPEFDQSNVFYSKVINTYFIVDKENHKISYVIGGNKFGNSIPLSPSTTVPYSGEEITDFRLMDTSTFTFLTINNETYASLNNFESFTKLNYKFTKVFELSTREILLLRDNGNIHLFNTTTGTVNDIVFISPKSQDLDFTPDYSISEVEGKYIVIFTSTPNGFTYKIKTIDKNTHTYGANQITSLDTEIDSTKLTSLTDITAEASTIKSVSNIYGLFVLVNHIHDGQTITNIVYLNDLIESGLSYIYKTTKVLKEFDYINQTESDISLPIKDLKATSMFMFGIGLNGELFIVDSSYVVRAIKTITSGDLYSDEKSMLYLEKDKDAEDLFLVENPYCNNVIDVIETPNGVFIVDKNGIYEILDTKELHCLIYTEDEFVSSIPEADINSLYGVFVAKNGNNYKFYKTNYDTKIIPRTHIKYKYIDLFNDLYQKYEEDKPVNEYNDELPIVKFNSILYVNFIDHLSSIYNTDKYNSIRYISDKTYGNVKIGLPIDKTFTQTKNDGTTVSKVGTFINKKFTLSTNKYGFKKYKDIIKVGDNVRISDINEVKRYVIRNEKDSGKDISLVSANIIKLLNDEYDFIIGDDKKTEKVKYELINKCHDSKEDRYDTIILTDESKFKYVKKYYTSLGVINNYGYFNKLVETPIGCFIQKEYVENEIRKGAVYYVPADILLNMITDYHTIPAYLGEYESSITPLTDLVLSCGWDATKFTAIKINEQYEFDNFDVKYIDNGHDTIILTGNGLTFAYECLNPETREWSSPFSVTNKISSIEIQDNGAFTSIYVDGNNVYLWNNTEIKPLYRYNVVTKQLDNAFVNITNSSKILNFNKIGNELHVIAYENNKLVYYTIDLISNIKTIIMNEIKVNGSYQYDINNNYEPSYHIVKQYETDKCYLMLICFIRKDPESQEINDNSYSTLLKFIKKQDTHYNQVNLYNNNPYYDKLTGFTICKDIEDNYKIVCVNNSQKDTIFPNVFIYNEITDIIIPLEIENKEKFNLNMCSDSFLDLEYNRDTGNIECINLYYLEDGMEYSIDKISIKIPGMVNSIGTHHGYEWANGEYVNGKMYKFKDFVIEYSGTRDIIRVYDFKDNKLGGRRSEFHTADFIQETVNDNVYMVTQDETPSQDKEYYILNTSQIHFSPINHTITYAGIGCDVVFKRVEISTNYVLVDTVNKQKYPLKGVQYYKKDLQGNYIEVNITHFDPIVKYYEKENKFVPIKTETLLNNENLSDQYYQADKYYFESASNTGSFDPNTVYFEKASISSISNTSYVNFLEEKNNCLYIKSYTACGSGTNTNKWVTIKFTLKAEISTDELEWSLEEYHYNIMDKMLNSESYYIKDKKIKINKNEYIAKVSNVLIGMDILVRCNEYCTELYNEYLNIDVNNRDEISNEEPYGCITQNGHVFITNIEKNKTYKLSDDYSSAILINDSHPLKIFDTESGIFGIALNTTAVLVYKFNEETGLFDDIIFDKNDGIFLRSNYDNNVCITMNDGFKAIFIFGILNNRPTCYRLYKGIVTIYNDLDPRIMCLPFNKYIIYESNNKICFTLNNKTDVYSANNYRESNVYIVDINTNKIICKTLCKPYFEYPTKIILSYFDDEKIYLISDKSGFIDYTSSDELYEQESAKALTPIDTYNTTLPIVDKDGFLWYKNSIVDIKTGLPDPTKYYRAYEKDKKTIRYEHIVFNDMITTEDGIFGIKDGCIYLNSSFSDSNDFVLVFSNIIEYNGTNYNIGNDSIHDVLLRSDKFGVFYHAPNGMIFRWNGSEFVCVFGNLINIDSNAKSLFDDLMQFNDINIESNKVNCLFYINENILLIKNKLNEIYYFDLNNNSFVKTNIVNPTTCVETSIGTIIKANNELKLITYLHESVNISTISHSGEYLYTTGEYSESVDMDKIIEDPVSKTIIILSNTPNGECYVIDKTDDGYKLFTAHISEDVGTDFTDDIIYRNSNNKILTNKRSFNVKFNEEKTDLIFENIQIFDTPLSALFEMNGKIYGLTNINGTTSNLVTLSYNNSTKNYVFENIYTNIFINRGTINSYNYLDYCCGLDWNGILFLSFSSRGFNGRGNILLSYGKIFERTIKQTNETGNVGFDLTFTIKNSNIFNNLDEITENSLIDKLVIKTTGVFTKGSILNLNSYIINNQRYKNLKEIESKYPSVFNLYKNIYKRFDNKNLMSYRFNEVLSNSDDSLVLGSIDKISKAEFNDLVSKILKIQELNDDYKVEINVYPTAVTKVETVNDTFAFGADGGENMPKLDRVPYLPFDPFRDDE